MKKVFSKKEFGSKIPKLAAAVALEKQKTIPSVDKGVKAPEIIR